MGDAPGDARPWSRPDRALAGGLVLVLVVSLVWTAHPHFDARNDASLYVLVTRSLLAGEGLTYLGEPFVIRPPGFAFLLAPVMAARGTDPAAFNLFVSLWGVALVLLLYVLLRPRTGGPLAAAAGLVVWFAPGVQELCNQVMSDVPGAALLLAALVLERRTRAAASPWADLGPGLLIGLAALVRTMDVLLVPAVVGARVIDAAWRARGLPRRRRLWLGCLALVLGAALPVLPWARQAAAAAPAGPTDQTHIHSYGTAQWHVDPADPTSPRVGWGELLARPRERLPQTTASLGTRLAAEQGGPLAHLAGGLGLLAVLVVFLRRREPAELFVLGALAVVGTYFAFKPRLVLPLFVLALGASVEVLAWGVARLPRSAAVGRALALALAALALLGTRSPDRARLALDNGILRTVCESLLARTKPGAVIAAPTGWELGVYLPERPTCSLRFAFLRDGEEGLLDLIERWRPEWIALYRPRAEDEAILTVIGKRASERYSPLREPVAGWTLLRRRG